MCETCGCGKSDGYTIYDPKHKHPHGEPDENGNVHSHSHEPDRDHEYKHSHEHSHEHEHEHEKEHTHRNAIDINIDILSRNNMIAGLNRSFLEGRKAVCFNMVSSPGSGKTTILEKTIAHFGNREKFYVIEGDQQSVIDAERIEKAGATALQINTGSGCHLDARMVADALKKLDIASGSVLFIENVGNLICPAMFDLGEFRRVIVTSVTEGEDKPLKYPNMFESSHLCIINKSDLLPYISFSIQQFMQNAAAVNSNLEFIAMSALTGEGMDKWREWILHKADLFLRDH